MEHRHLTKAIFFAGATLLLASCGNNGCVNPDEAGDFVTIHFDANTTRETNVIKDQEVRVGKKITKKPRVFFLDENPDRLEVSGWYTTSTLETEWDFKNDLVKGSMTLYAKWEKLCTVNYYLGDDPTPVKSQEAFENTYVREYPAYAAGYHYMGSFADKEYTTPFNFKKRITDDTNIYMRRSDEIFVSDSVTEEGEILTTHLYENVMVKLGSVDNDTEEGWAEKYTLPSGEICTYVNMGYSPNIGDPYMEFDLPLDITSSQILRFTFKNLGKCDHINLYFTAYIDPEKGIYSKTTANYSDRFMVIKNLSDSQREMDPEGEWTSVDFDLSSIEMNGYSVWGTSPYLGKLRFQATYKNKSRDDLNEFLVRSIEGIKKNIETVDSKFVRDSLADDSQDVLEPAKSSQTSSEFGLVFPKDSDSIIASETKGFDYYEHTDGLLLHTDNEIVLRKEEDPTATISFNVDKDIDLDEKPTLSITLQNLGYGKEISVALHNDEYDFLSTTITMDSRMSSSKTYTLNLFRQSGMYGKLTKVDISYDAVGVDNAIMLQAIEFEDYKPYDIMGINFNDKNFFGMESTSEVELSFNQSALGTKFDVATSGASVETTVTRRMTVTSYDNLTMSFVHPSASSITKVDVALTVGSTLYHHEFELDMNSRGTKSQKLTMPFLAGEEGRLNGVKLTFTGTGSFTIKDITFDPGEDSLRFDKSYQTAIEMMDWTTGLDYSYDSVNTCSLFTRNEESPTMAQSMYIGFTTNLRQNFMTPHTCYNILLTDKSNIYIVYQNRSTTSTFNVNMRFGTTPTESGDTSALPALNRTVSLATNMKEYEWEVATIEIPDTFKEYRLAKFRWEFGGTSLRLRNVSVK